MKPPILLALFLSALFATDACSPAAKAQAKTAIDVAREACEYSLSMTPADLPAGKAVAELCASQVALEPFEKHLLEAHAESVQKLSAAPADAGVGGSSQ